MCSGYCGKILICEVLAAGEDIAQTLPSTLHWSRSYKRAKKRSLPAQLWFPVLLAGSRTL